MIFLSENKETYFIPYFKEDNFIIPNRRILFDKYYNVIRMISKTIFNKRNDTELEIQLNYKASNYLY